MEQQTKESQIRILVGAIGMLSVVSGILLVLGIGLIYLAISAVLQGLAIRVCVAAISMSLVTIGISLLPFGAKVYCVRIVRLLHEMDKESADRIVKELTSKHGVETPEDDR